MFRSNYIIFMFVFCLIIFKVFLYFWFIWFYSSLCSGEREILWGRRRLYSDFIDWFTFFLRWVSICGRFFEYLYVRGIVFVFCFLGESRNGDIGEGEGC